MMTGFSFLGELLLSVYMPVYHLHFALGVGIFITTHASSAQEDENVALGGQTVQSSTRYVDWKADKAIDTSPLTCTHTVETSNPWWRVNLLDSYYISTVVITNRPDCCGERLDGAEIRIGNSLENNGNNNPRCGVLYGVAMAQSISVSCGDMNGRYVNVIIPGHFKILTLCDVQVYRTKGNKVKVTA
ncbi:fucolectin-4-like [Misgurnus anguillicaudatus]|uniref:fucolectin-4-like n=1 Tax=Misgurnus anguillicaudatus TaxID=75329 RepID=UPI003CCF3FD9